MFTIEGYTILDNKEVNDKFLTQDWFKEMVEKKKLNVVSYSRGRVEEDGEYKEWRVRAQLKSSLAFLMSMVETTI